VTSVEPLLDGVGLLGPLDELFPDMSAENWAPYRERYPELVSGNSWRLPIMCFLVRVGGRTVLVDTGAGPKGLWTDWAPEPESQERLLPELRRHDIEAGDVDIVFLTHVHIDHVGWNANDDGSPVFPRARYLLHEDALDAARERADRSHIQRCVLGLDDRLETVKDGEEVAPGLTVIPLPGHDQGHVGLRVADDAVIIADAAPHPAQLDHPEWTFGFDEDPQLAVETRRRLLDQFGDSVIYASHVPVGWRK
jgi:glyoxylase-like metal-dependent hydrolase (beta-lactamase superfamily II)